MASAGARLCRGLFPVIWPAHRQRRDRARVDARPQHHGGLGALSASVPVEVALPLLGWRGMFFLFVGLMALQVLAFAWFLVPVKRASSSGGASMASLR